MYGPEYLPLYRLVGLCRLRTRECLQQLPQFVFTGTSGVDAFRQCVEALVEQPVAPFFRLPEATPGNDTVAPQGGQRRADFVCVRLTQQLADELPLPPEGPTGPYASGLVYGASESLVERQLVELLRSQSNELRTQRLERFILALEFAFAGFWLDHRLSYPAFSGPQKVPESTTGLSAAPANNEAA